MKYYRYLYLSGSLEKKKDKVIRRLERKKLQPDIHIIALPETKRNQLEIYACTQLLQPDCRRIPG